jgi:hypothetical protein
MNELLTLAPLDYLGREIHRVVELVRPKLELYDDEPTYNGYCGVATEAYLHLAGGRKSKQRVTRAPNEDGTSHWWLVGPAGFIDLMLSSADRRRLRNGEMEPYPYENGQGAMLMNGYRPSKRAAAIIELVSVVNGCRFSRASSSQRGSGQGSGSRVCPRTGRLQTLLLCNRARMPAVPRSARDLVFDSGCCRDDCADLVSPLGPKWANLTTSQALGNQQKHAIEPNSTGSWPLQSEKRRFEFCTAHGS